MNQPTQPLPLLQGERRHPNGQTIWDYFGDADSPSTIRCPHCAGTGRMTATGPTARSADPTSSARAGDGKDPGIRFRATSGTGRALLLLADTGLGLTAHEIAVRIEGDDAPVSRIEGTRRRVSSLRRLGLISPSGHERPNKGSKTTAICWQITDRGLNVADLLRNTGWSV